MRVHVIETGSITGRAALIEGPENALLGLLSALVRPRKITFPVHAYVVEHPDGLIVIDTGLHAEARVPGILRPLINFEPMEPSDEVGPQMRLKGFRPEDVRWVIPTHLHVDHAGGLQHFPDAEILVHRREYDKGRFARLSDARSLWPEWLSPTLYDLDREPYYSFPAHKTLAPDVRLVPIPGHSPGQVAIVIDTDGPKLFFAGDHCLTQARFAADYAAGRLVMLGMDAKTSRRTSENIAAFVRQVPTTLVPAHDHTAEARLAAALREAVTV